MRFYIYAYLNPITMMPFYIGKGTENRCLYHITKAKEKRKGSRESSCVIHCRRLLKVGLEPIIMIISENLSENDAFEKEKTFIELFGRQDINDGILVNNTDGGEGFSNLVRSKTHCDNISKAKVGFKHTSESKNKMRKPKTYTAESKNKFKERRKAFANLPENKKRVSEQFLNTTLSIEHREKISNSLKTKYAEGIPHLHKIGAEHPGALYWTLCTPSNEIIQIPALRHFCNENNLNYSSLRNTLQTKKPISRGLSKGWQIISVS